MSFGTETLATLQVYDVDELK